MHEPDAAAQVSDEDLCTLDSCVGIVEQHVYQDGLACGTSASGTGVCNSDQKKCVDCLDPNGDGDAADRICGGVCPTCPWGAPCDNGGQCDSPGVCVDGVCCANLCAGVCRTCNGIQPGKCSDVDKYSQDTLPVCAMPNVCNGAGKCLLTLGQACLNKGDCASDFCKGSCKGSGVLCVGDSQFCKCEGMVCTTN
jgi:hypothetical protein